MQQLTLSPHRSLSPTHPVEHAEFDVEGTPSGFPAAVPRADLARLAVFLASSGILFDMDGTLVDSIAAVEAAWTSVAEELGQPAADVIAATHGRRAIDNLRDLQPKLRRLTNDQMEPHVEEVRSYELQHGFTPGAPMLTCCVANPVREAHSP